jgi:hypothetical protein
MRSAREAQVGGILVTGRAETEMCWTAYGVELNEENTKILCIPPGFGHAFLLLSAEGGCLQDDGLLDSELAIRSLAAATHVIVSEKEARV